MFSPTHGLFVFSPFLIFIPFFARAIWRDQAWRALTALLALAAIVQILAYAFGDWRQGASWGPRWLTDMLPIWMWMIPPALAAMTLRLRSLFAAACAGAIAIQTIGAFWYIGETDVAIFAPTNRADRMSAAWDFRNAPFLVEARHPPASPDLLVHLQGNIDVVAPDATAGDGQFQIAGWALTNSGSPFDLTLRIDGVLTGETTEFFERTDVVSALGEASPSGWRLTFPGNDLAPGLHRASVLVRASAGGDPRLLMERSFTIAADDGKRSLADSMRFAARAISAGQQPSGYWLTSFTGGTAFLSPKSEMNTFTNAAMIDIAGPVAEAAGISLEIERARSFLTDQIETGGLVRYHGRPDAPTIGSLGCAITPDADDTALVWRLAPAADRTLLTAARSTLDRFRNAEGLYRTWLAPREDYQCIDPGKDPNPTDFGIQMHVFMLLAQEDPSGANRLCALLKPRLDDDDLWVYYRLAPPVILMRLADLARKGCQLNPPAARLATDVSGQQPWVDAVGLLLKLEEQPPLQATLGSAERLLETLADDAFSLATESPPLVYHNDLSATVRRYYWSTELGLALWLRLYFAYERALSTQRCAPDVASETCIQPN